MASVFDTAAAAAIPLIYGKFGVESVFSPFMGDDVECTVIVMKGHGWEPGGGVNASMDQIQVYYQRADIDRKLKRGETFTVGSTVYTVRSMADYPGAWTDHEGRAVVTEA
jgi:hypothetical protein